jgi:arylsulfatase A-like enzyme
VEFSLVSIPTVRASSSQSSGHTFASHKLAASKSSTLISLARFALLGLAASSLLSFIEWIDLNIQLTPVFESASERLMLSAYLSLNLLVGSMLGLLVGLCAEVSALLKRGIEKLIARRGEAGIASKAIAVLMASALGAFLLNQQPQIHGYAVALLREAEKFRHLTRPLLALENLFSYLVVMGLLIGCSIVWLLARKSPSWPAAMRVLWLVGLLLIIGFAYYVDSRIEVQQYEYSMHRSMFLLGMTMAMALAASLYLRAGGLRFPKSISIIAAIAILAGVALTFARFDENQNLKTQIFYRTTQAKQHFKLAQWALDFDRDGYSPYLGGGDADDSRASINPGAIETIGDGVDNNCIGGDLTDEEMARWQEQFNAPNLNPSRRRLNVIYFFIDTMRDDHLGAYGYARNTSPNIDRLAARSSVFENAYTPSPYTYEAAPKFMQSTYWDARSETWTEAMSRNGYKTILFPRRLSMLLRHVNGMEQIVDASRKGLKQTIDAAIDVLGNTLADRPFCAYIYSSDPHRPYRPHEGINFGSAIIDQYDAEIAYTDYHLGRLFDWMEKSGRMNDTMVIIMSDHGESFGERMVYKHNAQVYDEQMRVPMIFYVPGLPPRRIADYVSTVDLGTTILNLVGIDFGKDRAGISLLPLMEGNAGALSHPPVYGEHSLISQSPYLESHKMVDPESKKYMVVTQDGYKLIYNRNFYNFELYNLKEDPEELRNLYDRMPEKAAVMKKLLGQFVDIVGVRRPWNADEQKFYFGVGDDEEDKQ